MGYASASEGSGTNAGDREVQDGISQGVVHEHVAARGRRAGRVRGIRRDFTRADASAKATKTTKTRKGGRESSTASVSYLPFYERAEKKMRVSADGAGARRRQRRVYSIRDPSRPTPRPVRPLWSDPDPTSSSNRERLAASRGCARSAAGAAPRRGTHRSGVRSSRRTCPPRPRADPTCASGSYFTQSATRFSRVMNTCRAPSPSPVPWDVPELPLEVADLLAEYLAPLNAPATATIAIETHFQSSGFDGDGDAPRDEPGRRRDANLDVGRGLVPDVGAVGTRAAAVDGDLARGDVGADPPGGARSVSASHADREGLLGAEVIDGARGFGAGVARTYAPKASLRTARSSGASGVISTSNVSVL